MNERGEFTDAAALLSKDLLSVRRANDDLYMVSIRNPTINTKGCNTDLSASMRYSNITTRVTLLSQFTSEEFIEFSTENTISDELSLFADLGRHIRRLVERQDKS